MFILLNGAFGIGKTTVANLLVRELAGAVLYDPERVGYVLHRLPPFLLGRSRQPEDYQDLWQWRWLAARGAGQQHRRSATVIVPMAFSNLSYWEELLARLERTAPVHAVCLKAPMEIVAGRLERRAAGEGRAVSAWEKSHAALCCVAHGDLRFGRPVDATATPEAVAAAVRASLAAAV